jgi:hypothetical protein
MTSDDIAGLIFVTAFCWGPIILAGLYIWRASRR